MNYLTKKCISVVIACYNEEENILSMYLRLTKIFKQITPNYELLFVDNSSTDSSVHLYEQLSKKDSSVRALLMSRNFNNADQSYSAGNDYAKGDAVVWIDGDLQDPPELIYQFVQQWLAGYDVVYGVRTNREGSLIRRYGPKLFYILFHKFSYMKIPLDAGDFSLLDRKIVNIINAMPERDRFVRGLRAWVGFKQVGVPYVRGERKWGHSTQGFIPAFFIARKGLFSYSYRPVSLITYMALTGSIMTIFIILLVPFLIWFHIVPIGVSLFIVFLLVVAIIQLLALAILGEYIGRMFEEIKGRPKYIVQRVIPGAST